METYMQLRPLVIACRYANEEELQKHMLTCGPMLIAETVSAAWSTNTNKEIFAWIAKHVTNTTSDVLSTANTVWATLVQLTRHALTDIHVKQITYFLKWSGLTSEQIWYTLCYPWLPGSLEQMITIVSNAGYAPDQQAWMWMWQAAWNAGQPSVAEWCIKQGKICLSALPPTMRTMCVFRKPDPTSYELIQTVPVEHLKAIIHTIVADRGIKTLCVEAAGGYRNIALEWELPERCGRVTRSQSRGRVTTRSLTPLRYKQDYAKWYEAPAASFKLLWLGLPPSYLNHLQTTLDILDEIGAQLVNITGHVDEPSSEDKNILIHTLRTYSETHLAISTHRKNMFQDANL